MTTYSPLITKLRKRGFEKMTSQDDVRLQEIRGSLRHLAMRDESARRRDPDELDSDRAYLKVMPPFLVDICQKILQSKAWRRLPGKTQVITSSSNPHVRNRAVHTNEVVGLAVSIADVLGLNRDLSMAIAFGHDLGHTPFGHSGEEFLSRVTGKKFRHQIFGAVLAQEIERKGGGLNLTHQTLRGILLHSRGAGVLSTDQEMSEETAAVMCADKIAFTWSDINDLFGRQGGLLRLEDFLEVGSVQWFGDSQRQRMQKCFVELCQESSAAGHVSFTISETAQRFEAVKKAMYGIYEQHNLFQPQEILGRVYQFLGEVEPQVDPAVSLALLTDEEVLRLHRQQKLDKGCLAQTSLQDILPYLRGKNIDFTDPKLDW